ncbi:MAG: peptidylprolyl isomerase [Ferruginibacter sp.]|nr:peptidylprolyl isomerase [Ferruginibacter sp.]
MKKVIFALLLICSKSMAQKKLDIAQIKTPHGEILVWLYNETPKHKASFIQLAKAGYWDSLTFNRVIPNFVIQGGCPDIEEGFKDPEYLLAPEFDTTLKHVYGTFAAGRDDNKEMNSARCQFYIVQNKKGLPRLDKKYTVYGKVIKGMNVVDTIANVPKDKTDTPLKPVTLDVNIIKMKAKKLKLLIK